MSEYIATFTTGFADVVRATLPGYLPESVIVAVKDGLVRFKFSGDYREVLKTPGLNNIFLVIKKFKGQQLRFEKMAEYLFKEKYNCLEIGPSFRIRFSRANQFAKVDPFYIEAMERSVTHNSKLRIDRTNPSTEFWFIIRDDDTGFYAQLLDKRKMTEKNLHKGELRPELAFLLCHVVKIAPDFVLCDPFAGYGAIPLALVNHCKFAHLYVSDSEPTLMAKLARAVLAANLAANLANDKRVTITRADARKLDYIKDASVDLFITDPPWGQFGNYADLPRLYAECFQTISVKLKAGGQLVAISSNESAVESALAACGGRVNRKFSTLVNGKKAKVYVASFTFADV